MVVFSLVKKLEDELKASQDKIKELNTNSDNKVDKYVACVICRGGEGGGRVTWLARQGDLGGRAKLFLV